MKIKSTQMNEQTAVIYTANILNKKGLLDKLPCQLTTLFRENRRSEHTAYSEKKGIKKGNRDRYGTIPFIIEAGKAYYQKITIMNWLTSVLIPKLEAMPA